MKSQSYGASPAIWNHTVLPATRHRWARPALTPAMQTGTRFTYPGGMEGWVDLVTRKRSRRESNSRPLGPESNALTTEPPSNMEHNVRSLLTDDTMQLFKSLLFAVRNIGLWSFAIVYCLIPFLLKCLVDVLITCHCHMHRLDNIWQIYRIFNACLQTKY